MIKKYRIRDYDFILILLISALTIVGILAIGSAEPSIQNKQVLGFILGLFMMIVISFFDYTFFLKFSWLYYVLNIGLLLFVLIKGNSSGGAQRWTTIFGVRFQPSETSKILLILFFAKLIMTYKEKMNSFLFLLICVALLAPPLILVYKQPDLSTTIMTAVVFCVMMFVGGMGLKYVLGFLAVAIPSGVVLFMLILQPDKHIINTYQQTRILAWLYPEKYANTEAYQQLNSIMAIGSGRLWGKGLNNNVVASVKNGNFISEPQTDFIFAVIGEEMGFVGSCIVIILLICIVICCIITAIKAKDLAGSVIAAGMGALVGFQGALNICVATGLLPNTGIPLPFVSAGLTSLVSLYIGMGFVLNVRLQCIRKYNN